MACPICNDALSGEAYTYSCLSEIEKSATSCKYCAILLDICKEKALLPDERISIRHYKNNDYNREIGGIGFQTEWSNMTRSVDIVVRNLLSTLFVLGRLHFEILMRKTDISEEDRIKAFTSGLVNTGSSAAADWAKEQMKQCKTSHAGCNYQKQTPLPDRVLDISYCGSEKVGSESWLESDVRLYETRNEQSVYAVLSHRWGEHQPLRLLCDNLSAFKDNIPWSALPKTFQDAVVFARRLNMPYIWVDSLCIIQDSKEDWFNQSSRMAGIYEHSSIALAATVALGGTAGCFIQPEAEMMGYITDGISKTFISEHTEQEIKQKLENCTAEHPFVFVRGAPYHIVPGFATDQDAFLPLLKRGWVYQERLLSARIIHFGDKDLNWECNEDIHCYCDNRRRVISQRVPTAWARPPKEMHAHRLLAEKNLPDSSLRWMKIVEEYTSLDLTFQTDKLPAIAGVAKQFRRCLNNTRYMAGLWEECLVDGLLWGRSTNSPQTGVALADAPSWSWASVPGPIQYDRVTYVQDSVNRPTVQAVEYECENEDEFMVLKGGSVTLHGHLMEVRLRMLQTTKQAYFGFIVPGVKGFETVTIDFEPDEEVLSQDWNLIHPQWSKNLLTESGTEDVSLSEPNLPENEDLDDEYPLPLYAESHKSAKQYSKSVSFVAMGQTQDRNGNIHEVLLILECINGAQQTYRRIGHASCNTGKPWVSSLGSRQAFTIV
jgi:hypothetical protein